MFFTIQINAIRTQSMFSLRTFLEYNLIVTKLLEHMKIVSRLQLFDTLFV